MIPIRDAIGQADPDLDLEIWPDIKNRESVNFIVAWNQPKNLLNRFPNLKVVCSLGAGADHLLSDDSIPSDVVITRVMTPSIKIQMHDYIETWCYNFLRKILTYSTLNRSNTWKVIPHNKKEDLSVGILGLGVIGSYVARKLAGNDWHVLGFSNSEKEIPEVKSFAGEDQFETFLNQSHILVNLLPATPLTDGILNLDLFKSLNDPSYLIQTGRGSHLVEEDLIYALDAGHIEEAVLDVFEKEPLPDSHTFWNRDSIFITPHVASITDPEEFAEQVVENYKRMISGITLLNRVDRQKGY